MCNCCDGQQSASDQSIIYDDTAQRFDIQWSNDGQSIVYDYHLFIKRIIQPITLKPSEQLFQCYADRCEYTITVRFSHKLRKWLVTHISMHDNHNKIKHKQCHHNRYTPTTTVISSTINPSTIISSTFQSPNINPVYSPISNQTCDELTNEYVYDGVILREGAKLLVHGYIREMKQRNVPLDVIVLCFHFLYILTTMAQLKQLKIKASNIMNTFQLDKLILNKISAEYEEGYETTFDNILSEWEAQKKIETFRNFIYKCSLRCITQNNYTILKIILYKVMYDHDWDRWCKKRMDQIMKLVNVAASCNALDCIKLLLENPDRLNWTNEIDNPTVLLNGIKYHNDQLDLLHCIIDKLALVKVDFVCNNIMNLTIKHDLVSVGRRIMDNGWHRLNKKNYVLAQSLDKKCYKWMLERQSAFEMYCSDGENAVDFNDWEMQ
eukprot:490451_1